MGKEALERGATRIAYVDGLRALSVLLVIVHHATLHFQGRMQPVPVMFLSWQHVFLEGSHGVDLFFVLSGFCLSYPFLKRLREKRLADFDIPLYFAKRVVRIVPPYYAAVAIFALTAFSMSHAGIVDVIKQSLFLDLDTRLVNGSFWTLAVEFRWYFLFPIALLLWVRAPRVFLAVALIASLAYNFTVFHFTIDAATLLPFMLGIVAAHIEIDGWKHKRALCLCLPFAAILAIAYEFNPALGAAFFYQSNPGWQMCAFILVIASSYTAPRAILSWKPLVAVGIASYSIYLVHEPIVAFVETRWSGPISALVAIVTSTAVGLLFWLVWERYWMAGRLRRNAVDFLKERFVAAASLLQVKGTFALREGAARPLAQPALVSP